MNWDRPHPTGPLWPFIAVAILFAGAVAYTELKPSAPPDPPRIASDCRAACTLEGMELAGVEISLQDDIHRVRCLCAPVQSSGGAL